MRFFNAVKYAFKNFINNFKQVYDKGEPKGVLVQCFGYIDNTVPSTLHKHMVGDDLSFIFGPIFYSFLFDTTEDLDELHGMLIDELENKTDGFWFFKNPQKNFFHYYNNSMRKQFRGYSYNVNIETVKLMVNQINKRRAGIKENLSLINKSLERLKVNNTLDIDLTVDERSFLLKERNNILDKINEHGLNSLTPYEQDRLDYLAKLNI